MNTSSKNELWPLQPRPVFYNHIPFVYVPKHMLLCDAVLGDVQDLLCHLTGIPQEGLSQDGWPESARRAKLQL